MSAIKPSTMSENVISIKKNLVVQFICIEEKVMINIINIC